MSKNSLIIRADADACIGTGHVMRCLALAQAWQESGGKATFLMPVKSPTIVERLRSEGIETIVLGVEPGSHRDASLTVGIAKDLESSRAVIDGYGFRSDYQQAVKNAGLTLLAIDDNGGVEHCFVDLMLNQNPHADEELYADREPYTRLLLGTRYALLRREFKAWRSWQRDIPEKAKKVLVTLGGSDPNNITLKIIEALRLLDDPRLEVRVVVGGVNPHLESLRDEVKKGKENIQLLTAVNNMPELMAWADVAVSAAGSTCLELAFMGLPTLSIIVAENQRRLADALERAGTVVSLGDGQTLSIVETTHSITDLLKTSTQRKKMSDSGQRLIDGEGADRVLMNLTNLNFRLRQVSEEDCQLVWEWANSPDVRAVSFSPNPISWEDHVRWFDAKLSNPECFYYLAIDQNETPVGQIRFDVTGIEAVISISLAAEFRGKGNGSAMIQLASEKLFASTEEGLIHAWVKPRNEASARAFTRAGYQSAGMGTVREQAAWHFTLKKEGVI